MYKTLKEAVDSIKDVENNTEFYRIICKFPLETYIPIIKEYKDYVFNHNGNIILKYITDIASNGDIIIIFSKHIETSSEFIEKIKKAKINDQQLNHTDIL